MTNTAAATNRRDQLVEQARRQFAADRTEPARRTVKELVDMGHLNWELLDQAWRAAEREDDAFYMEDILARIDEMVPGYEHEQLSLLRARQAKTSHDWQATVYWLEDAESRGLEHDTMTLVKAHALERLFRPEEALALLERDFPRGGYHNQAQFTRATALKQLKRIDEALELLNQWLPEAYDAGELDESLAGGYRLLGKILDERGEYDAAWEAFGRGNALRKETDGHVIAKSPTRWRVESWRELFARPDWVQKLRDNPIHYDGFTPVFLVGFPRSGTTLLEQVLDAHAGIQALEEKPMIYVAIKQATTVMLARARMQGKLRNTMHRKAFMLANYGGLPELGDREMDKIRETYFNVARHYTEIDENRVFVDKHPLNLGDMGFILRLFPHARFIVALRHPADCVLSCLMQNFGNNDGMANFLDPDHAFSFYKHVMDLLGQYENMLGIRDRIHYIKYEDMLGDFEGEIRSVLNFMGLDWDESVTRYYEHARTRGSIATPSYQGVTQKLYTQAVNRWHNYAHHLEPYLHYIRGAAERFGYSLEIPRKDAE